MVVPPTDRIEYSAVGPTTGCLVGMTLTATISIPQNSTEQTSASAGQRVDEWHVACLYRVRKEQAMKTKTNVKAGQAGRGEHVYMTVKMYDARW